MLSAARLPRRLAAVRALHNRTRLCAQPGKDHQLSQDTANSPSSLFTPLDAASNDTSKQDTREASGKSEGVGFVEQVGSASKSGPQEPDGSKGGQVESMPPGFFSAIKGKLGLETTSGQAKQNRGAGVGVTGAGTTRQFHACWGNADIQPMFPPYQMSNDGGKKVNGQQNSSFSTSARTGVEKTNHTAESYFKDVDETPATGKTHQVDPSGTGAKINSNAVQSSGEYDTVSKKEPYDTPPSSGEDKDKKLRYGNVPGLGSKDQVSEPEEGPAGASAEGRKPEGRK
ncbi:hypothetical protein SCP_0214360 [Sparassis crispa]|uniref:Uncharacterized protein n=1 Tax=Sparassis crispa TaxID=139825 RepID=A0A401GDG9_9APHY|nr:hypothetical protein SCP_0214360 [Sparassis crispa]GBE80226.1 hypothetical protein SCP_0214360 [Sparassis crispa]